MSPTFLRAEGPYLPLPLQVKADRRTTPHRERALVDVLQPTPNSRLWGVVLVLVGLLVVGLLSGDWVITSKSGCQDRIGTDPDFSNANWYGLGIGVCVAELDVRRPPRRHSDGAHHVGTLREAQP